MGLKWGEGKDPTWKEGHCPSFDSAWLLAVLRSGPLPTGDLSLRPLSLCPLQEGRADSARGPSRLSSCLFLNKIPAALFLFVHCKRGRKYGWEGMRTGCCFTKNSKTELTHDIARGWGTGRSTHRHRSRRFDETCIISHRQSGLMQPICSEEVHWLGKQQTTRATRRSPAGREAGITAPKVLSSVKTEPGK